MGIEERNKELTLRGFEEMFNRGNLDVVDELIAPRGEDHQEAPGTDFAAHLRWIVTRMREAFPDLHFEVHDVVAQGDLVATRSTMTGTHEGRFEVGPFREVAPTGRRIEVPHMHFFRWVDGKNTDLWHVWDTPALMRGLGMIPTGAPPREGAQV